MKFNIFPTLKHIDFTHTTYDNINNFTFGGYLENRNGLDTGKHLGIDISVNPGTEITVPCDCKVIDVYMDKTANNGWGTRIIFQLDKPFLNCDYLIYGHLAHSSLPKIGDNIKCGDIVGKVANLEESGTWFPHIHIQLITSKFFSFFINDLENLDGYCHDYNEDVSSLVADPIGLISQ